MHTRFFSDVAMNAISPQRREAAPPASLFAHYLLRKDYEEFFSAPMQKTFCSTRISMAHLLSRSEHRPAALAHLLPFRRSRGRLLRLFFSMFTGLVILLAFASGVVLLVKDTPLSLLQHLAHAPISAIPLLLIGVASLCFQAVIRPTPLDLFKAGIVSAAFLLWGIDQLLPTGWVATTLGDIVIVLYVIDLGWMMGDRLKERYSSIRQKTQPLPVHPAHCLHPLPSSSDARPPELLPLSDLPTWQKEAQLGDLRFREAPINPSSVLKRYRLVPLHGADRR
jgi:hypothetical protein